MTFALYFSNEAKNQLKELKEDGGLAKRFRAVSETLKKLQNNPKHPGLQTHEYFSLCGPRGEKVFEAYAENNTPGAYRIFWCYGPEKSAITVLAITPHP
jgi:hypothetical protein